MKSKPSKGSSAGSGAGAKPSGSERRVLELTLAPAEGSSAVPTDVSVPTAGGMRTRAADSGRVAWDATRAEREALPARSVVQVYAKIPDAIGAVTVGLAKSQAYVAALATLPLRPDLREHVRRCADALQYAYLEVLHGDRPRDLVPPLIRQLRDQRANLLLQVRALAGHGLVDAKPLKKLRGGRAHLSLLTDVGVLCAMLERVRPATEGRTTFTADELQAVRKLELDARRALAVRPRRSDDRAELKLGLRRAFTLLERAYDDLRRGIGFLVWKRPEGYALVDDIVPPMSSGVGRKWERKRRERKKAAAASSLAVRTA